MRRLVVALVVLVLPLLLVACGGGGEEPTTAPTDQAAAPEPAAAAAAMQVPLDISATETVVYEPLPDDTRTVPPVISENIDDERPMIVYFYDTKQPVTKDQSKIISNVLEDNRDLIELASFDIGRHVTQQSDGTIKLDKSLSDGSNPANGLALADQLGVNFTPYVVVTDSNGWIVYRGRGLVDQKTLEREVLRVAE